MRPLTRLVRSFLADESGPTAAEYAIMLALLLVVCIAIVSSIGENIQTTFARANGTMPQQ